MKKLFLFFTILTLFSCSDNSISNDLLPKPIVSETLDLNLPEFINLNIVGSSIILPNAGVKGILVYRLSINSYKAFDLACPHLIVSTCSAMTFINNTHLKCNCDDSLFSILNGSPQTNGVKHFAREYNVTILSNSVIRINNF